eukprot:CAMPEP_0197456338 /NCGR_PEP_ID=MMETSP1175-20131217/43081_1 /TAXON_ID=1003142 /ORGANISM="Triceratium dubium, Strain CCMP147" /LENGTH=116 /DNA_ID=CAMNT_0042990393 /DNA_START=81 /DNA_END=431 /DNA_ORIENTATION=-
MIRALSSIARTVTLSSSSLFRTPTPALRPCLDGFGIDESFSSSHGRVVGSTIADIVDSIWFAVPKKRVSKSKKRRKTTWQKKIKMKENIILDGRTGELTLKHHLPKNWKKYLPDAE